MSRLRTFSQTLLTGSRGSTRRARVETQRNSQFSTSSFFANRGATARYGGLVGLVGLGSMAYMQMMEPIQAETAISANHHDDSDPLSRLRSLSATSHLDFVDWKSLARSYVVWLGSSQSSLVAAGPAMISKLEWAREHVPLLGEVVWRTFCFAMESTFYATFVGGSTVAACAPLVDSLAQHGIGALFNYSAEASVDGNAKQSGVNSHHIEETVDAVRSAAQFKTNGSSLTALADDIKPSLIAIKLSGLIFEPALLSRASSALLNSSSFLRGTELPAGVLFPNGPELSEEDHEALKKLHQGLRSICDEARNGGVRLFVDAEQSWYQPSIDRFSEILSEEFNRPLPSSLITSAPFIPIVHNTYQCYRRSAEPNLRADLAKAHSKGYALGAKLVRGAYVESERAHWSAAGSIGDCVIWSNKVETDHCFDSCAAFLEEKIALEILEGKAGAPGTGVCFATHNGGSTKAVLEKLRAHGLARNTEDGRLEIDDRVRGRMTFAQLLGMADNLTYSLVSLIAPPKATAKGTETLPLVVKYVPFASVDQALPYLIRRANENQSLLQADPISGRGGARGERQAIGREIRKRMGLSF